MTKKIDRIMIPYVFFSVVSAIVQLIVGSVNPQMPFNSPLWFLQTLFIAIVLYALANSILKRWMIHVIAVLIMLTSYHCLKYTNVPSVLPFDLYRALIAAVYVHIGTMLKGFLCNNRRELAKESTIAFLMTMAYIFALRYVMTHYDINGTNFINGSLFLISPIEPWVLSIAGVLFVLYWCRIVGRLNVLNWMGKNSLVIMCVHFPIIERLNTLCATLPLYDTTVGKLCLAAGEYIIVIGISCLLVVVCKKYIPQCCGYGQTLLKR